MRKLLFIRTNYNNFSESCLEAFMGVVYFSRDDFIIWVRRSITWVRSGSSGCLKERLTSKSRRSIRQTAFLDSGYSWSFCYSPVRFEYKTRWSRSRITWLAIGLDWMNLRAQRNFSRIWSLLGRARVITITPACHGYNKGTVWKKSLSVVRNMAFCFWASENNQSSLKL